VAEAIARVVSRYAVDPNTRNRGQRATFRYHRLLCGQGCDAFLITPAHGEPVADRGADKARTTAALHVVAAHDGRTAQAFRDGTACSAWRTAASHQPGGRACPCANCFHAGRASNIRRSYFPAPIRFREPPAWGPGGLPYFAMCRDAAQLPDSTRCCNRDTLKPKVFKFADQEELPPLFGRPVGCSLPGLTNGGCL